MDTKDDIGLGALEAHLIDLCRAIGKHEEPFQLWRGDCANMRAGLRVYDEWFVPIYEAKEAIIEAAFELINTDSLSPEHIKAKYDLAYAVENLVKVMCDQNEKLSN